MPPETCPNCGADVPRGARACPECGADDRTGWSEAAEGDRLGLPDAADFDHDEFVRNEFGGGRVRRRAGARSGLAWWIAIGSMIALMLWWLF